MYLYLTDFLTVQKLFFFNYKKLFFLSYKKLVFLFNYKNNAISVFLFHHYKKILFNYHIILKKKLLK